MADRQECECVKMGKPNEYCPLCAGSGAFSAEADDNHAHPLTHNLDPEGE